MNSEESTLDHPCRVIIIGLPYSGKKEVAKILEQEHKCKILHENIDINSEAVNEHKLIKDLLFNEYRGRAVYVMEKFSIKSLLSLKQRNFVNVVFIQSTFKKRFQNYCLQHKVQPSVETYQEFAKIQEEYQNKDYQECLQFTSVRIFNIGTLEDLNTFITKNIDSILRPFRPDYDEYFMKIADIARRRSNCMKSSVGAVIVNDNNRVVSTGYNGTPRGLQSCFQGGCERCNSNSNQDLDRCLCLHGQQSAILEVGIARTTGCKLYTTMYPCFSCAKLIKQAGIKKIYYMDPYTKSDNGERFPKANYAKQDIAQVIVKNIYY